MALVDIVRPRVLVELGTYAGVSYCSFCQAVKELDLDTRCYAIDTWAGDAQGGNYGPEVLRELREHHDPLYGGFSQLIQSTFNQALDHFENGTVDLLHIDGFHTYEAVREDFVNWLPKLSERGIVLFHDVCVRDEDFGVWKLWDEVSSSYPHFKFEHGFGLGVLAVGPDQPLELRNLLDSSAEHGEGIRRHFERLGSHLDQLSVKERRIRDLEWQIQKYRRHPAFKLLDLYRRTRRWAKI